MDITKSFYVDDRGYTFDTDGPQEICYILCGCCNFDMLYGSGNIVILDEC